MNATVLNDLSLKLLFDFKYFKNIFKYLIFKYFI